MNYGSQKEFSKYDVHLAYLFLEKRRHRKDPATDDTTGIVFEENFLFLRIIFKNKTWFVERIFTRWKGVT